MRDVKAALDRDLDGRGLALSPSQGRRDESAQAGPVVAVEACHLHSRSDRGHGGHYPILDRRASASEFGVRVAPATIWLLRDRRGITFKSDACIKTAAASHAIGAPPFNDGLRMSGVMAAMLLDGPMKDPAFLAYAKRVLVAETLRDKFAPSAIRRDSSLGVGVYDLSLNGIGIVLLVGEEEFHAIRDHPE